MVTLGYYNIQYLQLCIQSFTKMKKIYDSKFPESQAIKTIWPTELETELPFSFVFLLYFPPFLYLYLYLYSGTNGIVL